MTTRTPSKRTEERRRALRAEFIEVGIRKARTIARRRGYVNADDLRKVHPVPKGMSASIYGSILRGPIFEGVVQVQSERPVARGRRIWQFRLAETVAA